MAHRPIWRSVLLGLGRGALAALGLWFVVEADRHGRTYSYSSARPMWIYLVIGAALGAIALAINDRSDTRKAGRPGA
jgi:hypothetical protein